jgi:hypothetical protein
MDRTKQAVVINDMLLGDLDRALQNAGKKDLVNSNSYSIGYSAYEVFDTKRYMMRSGPTPGTARNSSRRVQLCAKPSVASQWNLRLISGAQAPSLGVTEYPHPLEFPLA